MKKKRNLLTIISSILGCIAICGFSVFGLLTRSKEKVQTKAASYVSLNTKTGTGDVSWSSNGWTNHFIYSYQQDYTKNYDGDDVYYNYKTTLTYYQSVSDGTNTYYYYKSTFGNRYSTFWESARENSLVNSLTSVSLSLTQVSSSAVRLGLGSIYQLVNYNLYIVLSVGDSSQSGADLNDYNSGARLFTSSGSVLTSSAIMNVVAGASTNTSSLLFNYDFEIIQTDYDVGYTDGYNAGFNDGQQQGYNSGSNAGYNSGYSQGQADAEAAAQTQFQNYYDSGYSAGYEQGHSQDSTVATIFSGILQVAMVPINFFLAIFNFEILGINLSAFIQALFTVVLTIIVLKTVLGKGGGSSDN